MGEFAHEGSRSRPEVGIVAFEHGARHQHGGLVAVCRRQATMRERPVA